MVGFTICRLVKVFFPSVYWIHYFNCCDLLFQSKSRLVEELKDKRIKNISIRIRGTAIKIEFKTDRCLNFILKFHYNSLIIIPLDQLFSLFSFNYFNHGNLLFNFIFLVSVYLNLNSMQQGVLMMIGIKITMNHESYSYRVENFFSITNFKLFSIICNLLIVFFFICII